MERVTTTTISRGKSQSVFEQKGQRVKVWCYNTELITEPKVQHEQYNTADSEPVAKLAGTEEEITNRDQDLADTELKTNTDWIRKIDPISHDVWRVQEVRQLLLSAMIKQFWMKSETEKRKCATRSVNKGKNHTTSTLI